MKLRIVQLLVFLGYVSGLNEVCTENSDSGTSCQEIDTAADVKIPNYATSDGRASDAPVECFDRHPDCNLFVSEGECSNNPGEWPDRIDILNSLTLDH
jgi:hypothetical protein